MSIRSATSAKAIDDILDMGFSEGWASRIVDDDAVQDALNKGWRTVQAPRFHNKFKDVYFPKEVAEELTRFVDLFEPKQLNKLQRLLRGHLIVEDPDPGPVLRVPHEEHGYRVCEKLL